MRKIIHIDMDCFFVSVEEKLDPSLKGKPVVVAGSSARRGVVSAANYEARKYGIHSAMATAKAEKLCPHLIIAPHHFQEYKNESSEIRKIFERYSSLIEPLSLDEAFLDVSENKMFGGSATLIARDIRKTILEERELNASAGIAPNKFLAKVASDWRKPNGQFTVEPDKVLAFTSALPIGKIFGVGKVTEKKMHSMGIYTCKDLQKYALFDLEKFFGSWGKRLYELSRGIDERPVQVSGKRKSFSVERTFAQDIGTLEEVETEFKKVYQTFLERWEKSKISDSKISGMTFKLKYFDFKLRTKDHKCSLKVPEESTALEHLKDFWMSDPQKIRLIGFGVKLKDKTTDDQLEMNL